MNTDSDRWRALYQRWWIDYNPLALASAALVLGGLTLLGQSAVFSSGLSMLAPSAIAELYALSLIGAAALLFRSGRRRAGVILALLAVVFQADLTLHVETSAYLELGYVSAPAWFVVFALKLLAIGRALRLKPARSTVLVLLVGGAGLAAWPSLLRMWGECSSGVSLWLFGVALAGLHTGMPIRSEVPLDVRGRRAIRFTWLVWAAALLVHGVWWVGTFQIDPTPWFACAALLSTRWCKREAQHWVVVAGVLAVAVFTGDMLSVVGVMAATTLAYAAWMRPPTITTCELSPSDPYRATGELRPFEVVHPGSRTRLALGSLFSLYLAVWSADGVLGDQPIVALAVLSLVVAGVAQRRGKLRYPLPLLPLYGRLLVRIGWLRAPEGSLEWGALALVLGFAALGASMIVQMRAVSAESRELSSVALPRRSSANPNAPPDTPR